jgi:CBS domain-containing protein
MAKLKDLLKGKEFYFAKIGMNVLDVAKYMNSKLIGAVPVLGENNTLKGIFSERDLLNRCISKDLDLKNTLVDNVMTKKVVVIESHDTPEYCLHIMKQENIRHIPIIEGKELIGMISMRDLLLYDMQLKEEKIDMLKAYIQYSG